MGDELDVSDVTNISAEERLAFTLEWIAVSLEKLVDISMVQLNLADPDQASFVEYAHAQRLFLGDLTQEALDELYIQYQESKVPDEDN